jgi:hypothetical protein
VRDGRALQPVARWLFMDVRAYAVDASCKRLEGRLQAAQRRGRRGCGTRASGSDLELARGLHQLTGTVVQLIDRVASTWRRC